MRLARHIRSVGRDVFAIKIALLLNAAHPSLKVYTHTCSRGESGRIRLYSDQPACKLT